MKVLKGILEEQLDNAVRLKRDYNKEINSLLHGSVIKKRVYNHDYYYQEFRQGPRVVFKYLGKLEADKLKKYDEEKHRRNEYLKMVKELNNQIKFLNKALSLKEIRNV